MTDLKLAMDSWSMPITPFCYFVAPELFSSSRLFCQFMDLPPEIHRIIFRFCDTPTLFHLMHASSYTRQECLPLFWEFREDNTWYRPENPKEIFLGQHPMLYDCPEFASRVTQVEITLPFFSFDRKQEFWRRFQDVFPSAQRVVLYDPNATQAWSGCTGNENFEMSELVRLAPPNITALAATPYAGTERGLRSQLWHRVEDSYWNLVKDPWTPMRVVLPPKRIRPGLLNDLLTSERLSSVAIREACGADWLKWETYVRYADRSGIECPYPGCNMRFPKEADWKLHHRSDKHDGSLRHHFTHSMLMYYRNAPAKVKAILDEKQRRINEARFINSIVVEELIQSYRENEDHCNHRFTETLAHELKENGFLVYAESLDRWELWCNFVSALQDYWDDPYYPDDFEDFEVDSNQEYPSDEDLSCEYAGKEYFDYSEYPDVHK